MSTETPAPFAPFLPTTPPVHPGATEPPTLGKKKRKRASKKKVASKNKQIISEAAPLPAPNLFVDPELALPKKPKRRTRKAATTKPAKRSPKYELQTILRVAAALKEPDQKLFEKLLGELSAMPKAGRGRVLKALNEVFG